MTGMDAPEVSTAEARRSPQLDRRVLVSNLVSGAVWLVVASFVVGWLLVLVGAGYVALASVSLAYIYARDVLSMRQEALAWIVTWLTAVAAWMWVAVAAGSTQSNWLLDIWFGLVVGTGCFLAWQVLGLALRRVLAAGTRP